MQTLPGAVRCSVSTPAGLLQCCAWVLGLVLVLVLVLVLLPLHCAEEHQHCPTCPPQPG